VYIDARWVNPSGAAYYDLVGTMMHELVHNVTGLTDPDIMSRLNLSGQSVEVSREFKKTCF
jgi:hypothetical protein